MSYQREGTAEVTMNAGRMTVEITIDEDTERTEAIARLELAGEGFEGTGFAQRNPDDPNVPAIGEELAVARALAELSHALIEAAVKRIETFEGHAVRITE
jgi:hypothetical protein